MPPLLGVVMTWKKEGNKMKKDKKRNSFSEGFDSMEDLNKGGKGKTAALRLKKFAAGRTYGGGERRDGRII